MLKPGGIVGLSCINLASCKDSATMNTARGCIWDLLTEYGMIEKIQLVIDNYENVALPYKNRKEYMVEILTSWSLDDYLNSCMTFSPVNNMMKSKGLSVEQGREYLIELFKSRGMTEQDVNSVYTWSHLCPLITASKPL